MKTMVITAIALLILSAGFGIWTAISGSPYNAVLFNVHKLASVAYGVLCVLYFINSIKGTGMAGGDIVLAVVFVISLVALLVSGALLSAKQPAVWLRIMHIISSVIVYIGGGIRLVQYFIG